MRIELNGKRLLFRQCCNPVPGRIISQGSQVIISSVSTSKPSNFTVRYILGLSRNKYLNDFYLSDQENIPQPPPAPWEGHGGLTSLLGANEAGIDNTFENVVLKDFPRIVGSV